MQKIVTIGGGTGQYQILRGLKNYECEVTAVVNMSDDGGSSGALRDEYGILPPGDARQCMVALADEERGRILRDLFNYRFDKGQGHNLGNLVITALSHTCGGMAEGMKEASKLLGIKGKVLPVTIDDVVLFGETVDGRTLEGQTEVSYPSGNNVKIEKIYHKPKAFVYNEAADAIRDADKVVICPGELYGSILPNFLVEGIPEALGKSKALRVYVCNLFTKEGTQHFKASDFAAEIEKYSQATLNRIIVNTGKPADEVLEKYLNQKSDLIEDDFADDPRIVRGEFVAAHTMDIVAAQTMEKKTILRHVPAKIARAIMSI